MNRGIFRLLSGLMAIYAAGCLGVLSAKLDQAQRDTDLLRRAVTAAQDEVAQLEHELSAYRDDSALPELAYAQGFISKGDIVFFDGG